MGHRSGRSTTRSCPVASSEAPGPRLLGSATRSTRTRFSCPRRRGRSTAASTAAAFDAEGRPIEASLLTRTWESGQISFAPDLSGLDLASVERIEEPHVYGGYFFDHFGHFLLESLARTWVAEEVGPMPFAWASGGPANPWQAQILGILGLDGPHLFPSRPTRFRRLLIPEPGYRIQGRFHPRHARFLGRFDAAPEGSGERIWLSRTQAAPHRRNWGETALQDALAARGWRIVHPQDLTVAEQVRLLAGPGVVAGLEGSAFHAAVLLRGSAARFIVLRKTTNANYAAIAQRRGILEMDLYGAFRLVNRADASLVRSHETARMVDALAGEIEACGDDRARLEALRERAEAEHSFERWERRQRRRRLARARAFVKETARTSRIGRAIRHRLG